MRSAAILSLALALAACAAGGIFAQAAKPADQTAQRKPATAEDIDKAIDKGVQFLFSKQRETGLFSENGILATGAVNDFKGADETTALLGLAAAGVGLKDHRFLKGVDALLPMKLEEVYCLSLRIAVLSHLLDGFDENRRKIAVQVLSADIGLLQDAQGKDGGWSYRKDFMADLHWDFCNTQMALFGLGRAHAAGAQLKPDTFLKAQKLYLDCQFSNGGWAYGRAVGVRRDAPYGSMTAMGLASLIITRDVLYRGVGCPCRSEKSSKTYQRLQDSVERALEWLDKNFTAKQNPGPDAPALKLYWLYGCARVGEATGLRTLNGRDWYLDGAEEIINTQAANGGWASGPGSPASIPYTAFALAFLAKGREPPLLAKLRFKGEWNNHPRDAANVVDFVAQQKHESLRWQVVNLAEDLRRWNETPILYISAETPLDLGADRKQQLRAFTDSGGTIFFEASCANTKVAAWWRATAKEIWPEWELKNLDKDHPLWTCDAKPTRPPIVLQGADDGLRTFIFFIPGDVSCPWNSGDVRAARPLFETALNLATYSLDGATIAEWRAARSGTAAEKYAEQAKSLKKGAKEAVSIARLRHDAGQGDLGANYRPWQILMEDAAKRISGLTAKELSPATPGEPLKEAPSALYLCGRDKCDLGPEGVTWLKNYLAGGGFLLAEALLGDARFEPPLKALLADASLEMEPLRPDHPLFTGKLLDAAGYDVRKVRLSRAPQAEPAPSAKADATADAKKTPPPPEAQPAEAPKETAPLIYGIFDGKKLVGLYSPYDIMFSQTGCRAWGTRGYAADDARALATNILLLLTAR